MSDNESKTRLQNSFEQKSWTEIKASSSWQIFKIMAEFVEGFENYPASVPVFPSLVQPVPNPVALITR